jgi:hypothetical protein
MEGKRQLSWHRGGVYDVDKSASFVYGAAARGST